MGLGQAPLFPCHWNTLAPMLRPLTPVVGELGFAMVPLPLTSVQVPRAGNTGVLPVSTVLVVGVHNCWSAPAAAAGLFGSKT